jgi:hypothetical protein
MKTPCRFPRILAAVLAVISSASLAHAFEGKVEMKHTDLKRKSEMQMTYFVKGARMRTEIVPESGKKKKNEGPMVGLFNWDTKEMTMLMPGDSKMYMVMKMDPSDASNLVTKKGDTEFKPTGRKEKIAGVDAEEYTGISNGKWTEVWVTKELGTFMMASQGKGKKMEGWEKFMKEGNGFPLRMIQRAKEGAPEDYHMETTSVEKASEPDSLFVPPPDYKKFEMPSMGDMLKSAIPKP